MDIITLENIYSNNYFKINKNLQVLTGLWPYKSRTHNIIRRSIVLLVLGMVSIPHVNGSRIWCGKDLGICAENICGVVFAAGCFLKYLVTVFSENNISKVYEHVAETWLKIQDPEEKAIMIKYAKIAKFKSVGYIGYLSIAGVAFSQLGMLPTFLDFITPLNQSRSKVHVVKAEFFVDQAEYYYEIYFAYCIISTVSITVLMAIDTMYTAVVHQNLAVFNVVKHRIQIATKRTYKDEDFSYNSITSAIRLHQESIKFNDLLETTYKTCFLLLICICVLFLTFGAITIMENYKQILDLIRMSMFEFGMMIHLFYLSWPGQLVISESSQIFVSTYSNEWYNLSEPSKTLIKMMLFRSMKPCCLTAGGLYVMNFGNYGAIIKTTLSYITVLAPSS